MSPNWPNFHENPHKEAFSLFTHALLLPHSNFHEFPVFSGLHLHFPLATFLQKRILSAWKLWNSPWYHSNPPLPEHLDEKPIKNRVSRFIFNHWNERPDFWDSPKWSISKGRWKQLRAVTRIRFISTWVRISSERWWWVIRLIVHINYVW